MTNSSLSLNIADGSDGAGLCQTGGKTLLNASFIVNNTARSSTFTTAVGDLCVVDGGCFTSPNYPKPYPIDTTCEITAQGPGTLRVTTFVTEKGYDLLSVNGHDYSGRTGPDGVKMQTSETIKFNSDVVVTFSGFEICFVELASGGGASVVGGTLSLLNSAIAHNTATQYGSVFLLSVLSSI